MLSIIISSHSSKEDNEKFKKHIQKTIGLKEYEILLYENHNQYSLTEIYNKGLDESKFDIVLFIHNDIIFNTPNWGRILINKFKNTGYDIIGLAGTDYLSGSGIWWENRGNCYGIVNHTDGVNVWESRFSNEIKEIQNTIVVDGVFFGVNKTTIKERFDENYFGFHFYDISFCFDNYMEGCYIGVITNIRITHKSVGQVNEEWDENRKQFISKNWKLLPCTYTDED